MGKNRKNKRRLQTTNYKLKTSKGFTLIEILLSLVILFLILGGITLFTVRTLQAYTKSRAMQNALENARFAIESLSKKIRTSHDIAPSGGFPTSKIEFDDNVPPNDHYIYEFTSNELQLNGTSLVGGSDTNITVTGNFNGRTTDLGENRRGYVTITINIEYDPGGGEGTPAEKDQATIRSTVSLRDYGGDNP